ncbi:MAG: phosphotransferase [Bdellovibrionales bacterium]|nr:phosphotransferase [Bdellovibrionales bacterium]
MSTRLDSKYFTLDENILTLEEYLRAKQWIDTEEKILQIERAGEGNMNCTFRVYTDAASFILKQSRPWVEKYPSIMAPFDRIYSEHLYYTICSSQPLLQRMMPKCLRFDKNNRILMLSDLGREGDCLSLYQGEELSYSNTNKLLLYLHTLHRIKLDNDNKKALLNQEMKDLNHFHIFDFPLQNENGLNLDTFTPGLEDVAQSLKNDLSYVARVKECGKIYLENGDHLLHGDFYPGSWIKKEKDLYVIDPEFCFLGAREFDLGVFHAHLCISRAHISKEVCFDAYEGFQDLDMRLVYCFSGIEVMRRLIGVAQLPLDYSLEQKSRLLEGAKKLVLDA